MTNMELISQTMFKPKEMTLAENYETVQEEKIEKCSVFINDFIDEYGSLSAKHYTEYQPSFRRCSSPGSYYTNRFFKCNQISKIPSFNDTNFSNTSINKSSEFMGKMKRRFSWSKSEKTEEKNPEKKSRRSTIQDCSVKVNFCDDTMEMDTLKEKLAVEDNAEEEKEEDNAVSDDSDYDDVRINLEASYPMMSGIRTRRGAVTSKETTSNYRLYNIVQKDGVKHQVYVCVVFLKIGEIDTIKEQYAADVLIKSKWREPMLDNQTEQLKYDWANSWSPKLYIENTIGEAKEHVYHMITFNEFNHAFLCEKRRVSGVFLENLELNHFPFDVQDLTITVASNLPTTEIRLVNDPDETHRINKQSFVDEQEWYLYKHIETEQRELAYEYTDLATVRPALSVKCRAARRPAYFIWNIFLVTFLICSLSLVTFAVDKKLPQNRLQLTYTLVLTLVAFKFVVNQCLPKISYLTYLDKYVISSLFILTLICLWHGLIVVIEKVSDRFKYVIPDDMEVYVIIFMAIGYLGYNMAFIVMIYCVACKRRRDMKQRDREYVEKVQCQMKYKGMRAMRMIQQTHQLHEVKENGNATFI